MIALIAMLAFVAWVYFKPLYPVTWFGRLWGKRVPWTAAILCKRYPAVWHGVQVRESTAYFVVFDFLLRRPKEYATIGCTLGRTILVRKGYLAPWLVAHELEHVNQWEERGWFAVTADAEIEAEEAEAEFQKQ